MVSEILVCHSQESKTEQGNLSWKLESKCVCVWRVVVGEVGGKEREWEERMIIACVFFFLFQRDPYIEGSPHSYP